MTVLVVALDDGIEDFAEAAQVILGPLLATFAAHLFASVLARVARQSAPPTRAELRHLTGHAAQYLVLAVVPLLVVVVGAASGLYDPEDAVDLVCWLGLAYLVVLGGVGGWRARRGCRGRSSGAVAAGRAGVLRPHPPGGAGSTRTGHIIGDRRGTMCRGRRGRPLLHGVLGRGVFMLATLLVVAAVIWVLIDKPVEG